MVVCDGCFVQYECAKAAFDLVERTWAFVLYTQFYRYPITTAAQKFWLKTIADGRYVFAPDGFMESCFRKHLCRCGDGQACRLSVSSWASGHGAVIQGWVSIVTSTLIAPTDVIKVNQSVVVDGLEVNQLTPGTEAPAEMSTATYPSTRHFLGRAAMARCTTYIHYEVLNSWCTCMGEIYWWTVVS